MRKLLFITPGLFLMFCLWFVGCTNQNQSQSYKETEKLHQDSVIQFINGYVDEIWNKGDFSKAEKYWGPDFRNGFAPELKIGPDGMREQIKPFLASFDSIHFKIGDIMVDGNKVSFWVEITAIHTGEFMGIPPTNKPVKFREAAWYEMKDGKLDVVYGFVDWMMFFEQIGQFPEM